MSFFFEWYNLIFTVPLLIFFALLILQVIGFGIDNILNLDIDLPVEGASIGDVTLFANVLFFFNADKVAVGLLVLTYIGTFGMVGLVCNAIAFALLKGLTPAFLLASIPVALFGAMALTKACSGLMAKHFPSHETYGAKKAELQGAIGTVLSARVDQKGGRAHVKDRYGNLLTLFCEMAADEEPVDKGGQVILIEYDDERHVYLCCPSDELSTAEEEE